MILKPDNPFFKDLPGISVLVGGMWVANLSYWGFNQYIIQRAWRQKACARRRRASFSPLS